MDPAKRIVTTMPLHELWDRDGPLPLKRGRTLSAADIAERLRVGPVRFVVADVGPLTWVEASATFRFWKEEVKPHLVDPLAADSGFFLDTFPGSYAYVATEWLGDAPFTVVLLETYH